MTDPADRFDAIVAALQPLLEQHGFHRAEALDAQLQGYGTRRAAFAAGEEAVRLIWDQPGGYVVLEALEPEFGGTWADMLLKFIDLPRATSAELQYLDEILREELIGYFWDVMPLRVGIDLPD